MNNKKIITSSGIELQNNQPLDVRDRIQTLSEVNTILNPDIGGIFYCLDTGYYYTITSLTDDLSKVKDYELFTSVGAESVTVNDEIIKVTDSNIVTIPDDSGYIYESKELRNSQRINITRENSGKTYNNFYSAENDLKEFLGKTLPSDLKNSIKMVCTAFDKTNQDLDRDIISDISGNGNNLLLSGFSYTNTSGYGNSDYPCALVTDGIDDIIYSDKTINQIIGNSDKITIVSMITQISDIDSETLGISTNNIRYNSSLSCLRNIVSKTNIGKTGIYGYTCPSLAVVPTVPTSIKLLGDKEDYVSQGGTHQANDIFSVTGYKNATGDVYELSQVAWYWTFIANKVLTEDEINLVIEYYNLDRCITPQVYYNISQQGITNNNHSDFSDKLVDLSGNGYDMQLNNIGWEGESGINSYPVVFGANKTWDKMASGNNTDFIFELTGNSIHLTKANDNLALLFTYVYKDGTVNEVSIPTFKLKVTGVKEGQNVVYNYVSEDNVSDITSIRITEDGEYVCPKSTIFVPAEILSNVWIGFKVNPENIDLDITIEVLPTIEHALCLDGINDFGKVTGLPVLKDYTVAALRKWLYGDSVTSVETGSIVSKSKANQGASILEQTLGLNPVRCGTWNFGTFNALASDDKLKEESFTYQTKYSYNGNPIQAGAGVDGDTMWLGTIRDGDSRFSKLALWSLLLYPYSMSEFLLERQLRKLKVGTLYPGMTQWKPIFKGNLEFDSSIIIYNEEGVSQGSPISGKYYPIGAKISIEIKPKNTLDKVSKLTYNGEELKLSNITSLGYYIYYTTITKSPQKIDIIIDEYIRYEDILQPYPTIIHFKNEDGTHEYTWGDEIKVGSKIRYLNFENLLPDFYAITGALYFNGNRFGSDDSIKYAVVEKTNVLNWSVKCRWKLTTPEALFMYDPAVINNIGLKNLGYLPDITGQGRHLKLNNFTHEGMSGKDGYPVIFGANKTWTNIRSNGNTFEAGFGNCFINLKKVDFGGAITYTYIKSNGILTSYNKDIPSFKVKIQGLNGNFGFKYTYIDSENSTTKQEVQIIEDGIYTLPKSYAGTDNLIDENIWIGLNCFDLKNVGHYDCNVIISVIPEHPDSLCFNGIDNYGSIPTLTYGGKCLIMKTNWQDNPDSSLGSMLYDQRISLNYFAIYLNNLTPSNEKVSAYNSRNIGGETYIDNILNKHLYIEDLKDLTHCITIINNNATSSNTTSPVIGSIAAKNGYFSKFAMYRTVLLPEAPNEQDRTSLNNWAGIEGGYVEKPEYYWDTYGKTNLDIDKGYIKDQVSLQLNNDNSNNNSLENFNFGYEGMSGYNGYPVMFGANKTWTSMRASDETQYKYDLTSNSITIYKVLNNSYALLYSYAHNVNITNEISIPSFKAKVSGLKEGERIRYLYISSENTSTVTLFNVTTNGTHIFPASVPIQVTEETPETVWIGFVIILNNNENVEGVTIEVLPEYSNGLCLDGIDDYMNCNYVPVLTDYTYVLKRELLSDVQGSCSIYKGTQKSGGGAFIVDYTSDQGNILGYSFGMAKAGNVSKDLSIIYGTKTSVNGVEVVPGSQIDDTGITIGKWTAYKQMVFYKMMLWPKTINSLSIGMIQNLMEQDEIIDLKNKLFKKDTVISSVSNETSISNNTLIQNN